MSAQLEEKEVRNKKTSLRKGVFIPSFAIIGGAALIGIFNNDLLTKVAMNTFTGSLRSFGWLYQIISVVVLILSLVICFSKVGNLRFGGKNAKPKYSFMTWFAMALTGGIATGVVTYGVNEPIIYFGNIYGELSQLGVEPGTTQAAIFSIARSFYNWSFVPYAMYAICGLLVAYMYFNKKKSLTVSATLIPLFGEKVTKGVWPSVIDTLALLAIALGLSSSLGAGFALVGSGLEVSYGIQQGIPVWLTLAILITAMYTISSYVGLDKGIRRMASLNSYIFYFLLAFLFIIGPTLYILRTSTAGMAMWLDNFWNWGLDPIDIGGEALVMWWTLYDWAIWIAYAPLMGLFLAVISYGRTVREYMIINWVMPSVFGIIWFGIWGSAAIKWQIDGRFDLVKVISETGAVAGLWTFLSNIPLGFIFIPIVMFLLMLSFSTNADSMTRTIAALCTNNLRFDEEPPTYQKLLWGLSIGFIAFFMVAFAGGAQGVDGVKYLAAAGGFMVLFVFVLQVISAIKAFFIDEIIE